MNALPDKPLKPHAALRTRSWYPTNSLAAPRLEFHVFVWKRWHNRDSPYGYRAVYGLLSGEVGLSDNGSHMTDAFIIDAVHTPRGKRGGALAALHPVDLYAVPLAEVVARTKADPERIGDVVAGCVSQVGDQGRCIARGGVLAAGLPTTIPGVTVNRFCGSSLQAVHDAAMRIKVGCADLMVAGGVESMSQMPIGSAWSGEHPRSIASRFDIPNQYAAAERIAAKWGLSREDCEQFALASQHKAAHAWEAGHFDNEICEVSVPGDGGTRVVRRDEHMRPHTTRQALAGLKPIVCEHGVVTAGTSSGVVDAASAVLLASEREVARANLRPRARIVAMDVCGSDPELVLTGPIPATQRVLRSAGLSLSDIDLFENNEAFAAIPLAWMKELSIDPGKVNVNGGAIALGHPLGATGAILLATLVNELERRKLHYGLVTICMGYGMGIATVVERC